MPGATTSTTALVGVALMVLGTVQLGVAALLNMARSDRHRWTDTPTVLALTAALLVVLGLAVTLV